MTIHTILVIECAWCKQVVGRKEGHGVTGFTSTICPECRQKYFPDVPQRKNEIINA